MANKHQVLELLAKGLTPKKVAEELGCRPEYVRATRLRAEITGYANSFESVARYKRNRKRKYREDPEFRDRENAYKREWRMRKKAMEAGA